jgi:phage baseplate assembly protein W|tara:strand:+ start:118 stop:525 length:408 start_codon:yes stop_codon:yes gene_type:complete
MAVIKGTRRISPLNLNKNVTIGVAFPLDETNLFKGTETLQEQAKANLLNLLLTQRGERVNVPDYGVGLKSLLFEQQIKLDILKDIIIAQTSRYISNIKILDVQTNLSEDKSTLGISIVYRFTLDGSADSIQLNFK